MGLHRRQTRKKLVTKNQAGPDQVLGDFAQISISMPMSMLAMISSSILGFLNVGNPFRSVFFLPCGGFGVLALLEPSPSNSASTSRLLSFLSASSSRAFLASSSAFCRAISFFCSIFLWRCWSSCALRTRSASRMRFLRFSSAMRAAAVSDCVAILGWASELERVRRCAYFFDLAMRALMSASVQWWFCRALRSSYFRCRYDCVGTLALASMRDWR